VIDENEKISRLLCLEIPEEQMNRVLSQEHVDIAPEFMGFVDVYYHLAQIIPKHFTIVDLGCAFNPQCFLFPDHKRYISVDNFSGIERFISHNCSLYVMSISDYIKNHIGDLNLKDTFAICSYVPPWGDDNMKLARENFLNVFTYYPHSAKTEIPLPPKEGLVPDNER